SPDWNGNRGAATWGNGTTGAHGIVSEANSLVGNNIADQVGLFAAPLGNGNYVVQSPYWNGSRGAGTWGDGLAGKRFDHSNTVSEANSLVGTNPPDEVGYNFYGLPNGNYVLDNWWWNGNRGAVTWGDGTSGVRGPVSEANSLVGTNPMDDVGRFFR